MAVRDAGTGFRLNLGEKTIPNRDVMEWFSATQDPVAALESVQPPTVARADCASVDRGIWKSCVPEVTTDSFVCGAASTRRSGIITLVTNETDSSALFALRDHPTPLCES